MVARLISAPKVRLWICMLAVMQCMYIFQGIETAQPLLAGGKGKREISLDKISTPPGQVGHIEDCSGMRAAYPLPPHADDFIDQGQKRCWLSRHFEKTRQ